MPNTQATLKHLFNILFIHCSLIFKIPFHLKQKLMIFFCNRAKTQRIFNANESSMNSSQSKESKIPVRSRVTINVPDIMRFLNGYKRVFEKTHKGKLPGYYSVHSA